MEIWLDKVKDNCNWKVWCFGHYHADRLERPRVEMFFQDICELEEVWERWETSKVDWWLDKSPNYYPEGFAKAYAEIQLYYEDLFALDWTFATFNDEKAASLKGDNIIKGESSK